MNLPKVVYVFMDRDDEGREYPVAHETVEEISPAHSILIGVYELKETVLLAKGNGNDKK